MTGPPTVCHILVVCIEVNLASLMCYRHSNLKSEMKGPTRVRCVGTKGMKLGNMYVWDLGDTIGPALGDCSGKITYNIHTDTVD